MIEEYIVKHESTDNGESIGYVQPIVRCKDCMNGILVTEVGMLPFIRCFREEHELEWFCADGKRR